MITTVGDRLAGIALAFAVLDVASATALGIVFAFRQGVQALVVVAGGVVSDRLPRNLVLVGASLVQGVAQAATAFCVLGRRRGVEAIVVLQAVYGLGAGPRGPRRGRSRPADGEPRPAPAGEALQGLTRNVVARARAGDRGAIVVAGSPGVALALDAVSFLVCAELLRRIRVARPVRTPRRARFLTELREGWREFTSRTWLWASVVLFGIGNLVGRRLDRARPAGRRRAPRRCRPLGGDPHRRRGRCCGRERWSRCASGRGDRSSPASSPPCRSPFQTLALALEAPTWVIASARSSPASGSRIHLTLWFTVFQQQVPERAQSRVASYDTLGSFVLMPLGLRARRPARGRDRDHRDALDRRRRDVGVVGGNPGTAVRLGDPRPAAGARAEPGVTTIGAPMSVRVRMAPSPTGLLHIGGVHTFLFNWLFARGRERRVPAPDREHRHEPRGRRVGRADPALAHVARDRLGRAGDVPARRDGPLPQARPASSWRRAGVRGRGRDPLPDARRGRDGLGRRRARPHRGSRTRSSRTSSSSAPTAVRPTTSPRRSRTWTTRSRT